MLSYFIAYWSTVIILALIYRYYKNKNPWAQSTPIKSSSASDQKIPTPPRNLPVDDKKEVLQHQITQANEVKSTPKSGYTPTLDYQHIPFEETVNLDNSKMTIVDAVKHLDMKALEKLLLSDTDINMKDSDGETALQWASYQGSLPIVSLLLKYKADVNIKGKWQNSALHWATSAGHQNIMQLLLQTPNIQINMKNDWGDTALMGASFYGREKLVKILLDAKADVIEENARSETALFYAVTQKHPNIVEMLVNRGANVNVNIDYFVNIITLIRANTLDMLHYNRGKIITILQNKKEQVGKLKEILKKTKDSDLQTMSTPNLKYLLKKNSTGLGFSGKYLETICQKRNKNLTPHEKIILENSLLKLKRLITSHSGISILPHKVLSPTVTQYLDFEDLSNTLIAFKGRI